MALFVGFDNMAANVFRRVGSVGLEYYNSLSEDAANKWIEIGFDPNYGQLGHWSC